MESNDFVIRYSDRSYVDGLGRNTITKNEELFIEGSIGFNKEKVDHSLADTLKLLVDCINSLLHVTKQNKKKAHSQCSSNQTDFNSYKVDIVKSQINGSLLN